MASRRWLGLALICTLSAFPAFAQFGRGRLAPRVATANDFDGSWQLCRLAYQGRGWSTDYPDADYNFSTRLSELTRTAVARRAEGEPQPVIVRPTDDTLFRCGFVMLWQAESLYFSEPDALRMREYLLKGGFLWADDSWGTFAWENFAEEMAKVLSPAEYRFVDIPPDHGLFSSLFHVARVPQIPGISFWFGTGGLTSERGADSAEVNVRGIFDARGRLLVLATHNTDIADGWEREGASAEYFYRFSVDSYAIGINIAIYTMLH
ncbi:MAG TPA: DUF4159 domain-containing protein [Vicinamibacterales bacterium]|nr:DUF4159 domain-containing protein [Vicinamibacterales bacterium]